MNPRARLLVAAASLLLIGMFVLPIWRIDHAAPQYPEGLGMEIRINTIRGDTPFTLGNINNLNHYIGMKAIDPDAVPELSVMPWLVGALSVGGLLVAALGRRRVLYAWATGFIAVAVVGLVDFWRWTYDYGHNLDYENAIIKVPGMSYQPPLIGTKQLLNFTATSWPGAGGWLAFLAMALALTAVGLTLRSRRGARAAAAALAVSVAACAGNEPHPIAYDEATCAYCHMGISDRRFGAQLVTVKGKVHSFDSIECLASYYLQDRALARVMWVTDFTVRGTFIRADTAQFVRSSQSHSPMGLGLMAFGSAAAAARVAPQGAVALSWRDVIALVERTGGDPHATLPTITGAHGASL